MSNLKIDFYSNSLVRPVSFEMYIPNDPRLTFPGAPNPNHGQKCKTVFVLHGYTGWGKGWDFLYEQAEKYNFALVFPSGENSFYLDSEASDRKYAIFTGSELIEYIRKTFNLCMCKEDTFISGLSMGGFGAIHTALAFPDNFGKIAALSSALIIHGISGMKETDKNEIANYYYYRNCFGDLDNVVQSDSNPEVLVKKLKQQGKALPKIYMACGTEDFLLEPNRRFNEFLKSQNVPVTYIESPGGHDMPFWNEYFAKGFQWLAEEA
jgi:S-formylglutathione hydrolase FrmB